MTGLLIKNDLKIGGNFAINIQPSPKQGGLGQIMLSTLFNLQLNVIKRQNLANSVA